MSTRHTHLHKFKNFKTNNPVQRQDIVIGGRYTYPSGMDGVFTMECYLINDKCAEFKCLNEGWEAAQWGAIVEFDVPDLTNEQIVQIDEVMKTFSSWRRNPSEEDHKFINRADALGYVSRQSHTQVHWTEFGLNRFRASKAKMNM